MGGRQRLMKPHEWSVNFCMRQFEQLRDVDFVFAWTSDLVHSAELLGLLA